MWALLCVVFCAFSFVQTNETTGFNQDFGPLHFYTKSGDIPEKQIPMRWEARRATRKAKAFVNFIITQPALNPLKISKLLGPYKINIPDLKFFGNLTLKKFVVTGINSSSINNLEFYVIQPRIDMNVSLPEITATVNFGLKAVFDEVPIDVYGNFSATLLDLVFSGAIGPIRTPKKRGRLNAGSVYQLDSTDVTIDVRDLQVQVNMNQYANEFKLILEQFFLNYEALINDNHLIKNILMGINQELEKIPIKRIAHYLIGTAELGSKGRDREQDNSKNTTNARKYYYGK